MDNFNFGLLRIFLVVSRLKSFSKASEYLYVDQSTISKKISQLENKFNLKLFFRTAHGVELTVAGRQFEKRAQRLADDFAHLQLPLSLRWSDLRIGAFDNIAAYYYPAFFADHFPQLRTLKIANEGMELVELFNRGELDLIIVNASLADQIKGKYVHRVLAKENFQVLAGSQVSAIAESPCTLADLRGHNLLIAPKYCPVTRHLLQWRRAFGQLKMVDYTATMIQLIRRSDYITILPDKMVAAQLAAHPDLASTPLADLAPRKIAAFAREQPVLDKVVGALTTEPA